jgi:hypothetical protein
MAMSFLLNDGLLYVGGEYVRIAFHFLEKELSMHLMKYFFKK